MKTEKLAKLKQLYKYVEDQYVQKFCNKHGLEFDYFGGDIYCFGDYFFSFNEIKFDLENKLPKGLIIEWQNDSVEYAMNNPHGKAINLKSYSMGLRYKDL